MKFTRVKDISPAFAKVLLEKLHSPYSLFAQSVVLGRSKGAVLVDDELDPREALILSQERVWWQPLDGKYHVDAPIPPAAFLSWQREEWRSSVYFYSDAADTESLICRLRDWRMVPERAIIYERSVEFGQPISADVPERLRLLPYNKESVMSFVREQDQEDLLEGACKVCERVGSFFPGYILVSKEGEFIASCTLDYVRDTTAEIGVDTAEEHRRQGMSTCAVACVLSELAKRGIKKVIWHAPVQNVASQKTAERAGFAKAFDTVFLACHGRIGHNILHCGYLLWQQGEALAAADLFEEAIGVARRGAGDLELGEFTCEQVQEWIDGIRMNKR